MRSGRLHFLRPVQSIEALGFRPPPQRVLVVLILDHAGSVKMWQIPRHRRIPDSHHHRNRNHGRCFLGLRGRISAARPHLLKTHLIHWIWISAMIVEASG